MCLTSTGLSQFYMSSCYDCSKVFAGHWSTAIVKDTCRVWCFLIMLRQSSMSSLAFHLWKSLSGLSVRKVALGDVSGCDPAEAWPHALRHPGELEEQCFAPLGKVSPDWDENVLCRCRTCGDQKVRMLFFCLLLRKLFLSCWGAFIPHVEWRENVVTGRLTVYIITHAFYLEPSWKQHSVLVLHVETSIYLRKYFVEYKWK